MGRGGLVGGWLGGGDAGGMDGGGGVDERGMVRMMDPIYKSTRRKAGERKPCYGCMIPGVKLFFYGTRARLLCIDQELRRVCWWLLRFCSERYRCTGVQTSKSINSHACSFLSMTPHHFINPPKHVYHDFPGGSLGPMIWRRAPNPIPAPPLF